jgi:hypothetical protein
MDKKMLAYINNLNPEDFDSKEDVERYLRNSEILKILAEIIKLLVIVVSIILYCLWIILKTS